jgi:hypothetical protein
MKTIAVVGTSQQFINWQSSINERIKSNRKMVQTSKMKALLVQRWEDAAGTSFDSIVLLPGFLAVIGVHQLLNQLHDHLRGSVE